MTRIAVLGLGEAGSIIANDLAAAGALVIGFDPVAQSVPDIQRASTSQGAVREADLVLSLNASAVAVSVLTGCIGEICSTAVYADLNSTSPEIKRELAALCLERDLPFADVALMTPVPGKGLATPMYVSGTGAAMFASSLAVFGADVEVVGDIAGDAAIRKLLRSIYAKGLAAVVIDAIEAASRLGHSEWMRDNIERDLESATRTTVERLITGTAVHVARRTSEVTAAKDLVESVGYSAPTSIGTLNLFREITAGNISIIEEKKRAIK